MKIRLALVYFSVYFSFLLAPGYAAPPASKSKAPLPPAAKLASPVALPVPEARRVAASPVWSVAFSPDGTRLAVGGYQRVRLYETATGKKIAEWPVPGGDGIRGVSFSSDNKFLAIGGGIPAQSGVAIIVDVASGKVVRTLTKHGDQIESVAFYGDTLLTASADEKVFLTNAATGAQTGALTEHNGKCLAVAVPAQFADDNGGEIFATGGEDKMIKIWDARTRRTIVNFDQCASPIWSLVARRPPGHFVAGTGDGKVRYFAVYKDKNGKPDAQGVQPRGGYQETEHDAHEGPVYAIAVAPSDGFVVSGGADAKVAVWGMGGGRRREFAEAESAIYGVAVSNDSKRIASASMDGKTRIYDAEKLSLLLTLDANGVYSPPPSPVIAMGTAQLAKVPLKSGVGLTGKYWTNRDGSGKPTLTRVDPTIDFTFTGVVGEGVTNVNFFARWEGFVEAPVAGDYTFYTRTDDGVRLWVNGKQIVDSWINRGEAEDTGKETIALKAGQRIPIKMDYFQSGGGASARLLWSFKGQDKQIIPKERLYPLPAPDKKLSPVPAPAKPAKPAADPKAAR